MAASGEFLRIADVAKVDGANDGVIIVDDVPFDVVVVAAVDTGPRNTPPTPLPSDAAAAAAALAQAAAAAATAVVADDQVVVNCRHIVCHIEGK